jgi:hypothetical protein
MYAKRAIRGYGGADADKDIPDGDKFLYQANAENIMAAISYVGPLRSVFNA